MPARGTKRKYATIMLRIGNTKSIARVIQAYLLFFIICCDIDMISDERIRAHYQSDYPPGRWLPSWNHVPDNVQCEMKLKNTASLVDEYIFSSKSSRKQQLRAIRLPHTMTVGGISKDVIKHIHIWFTFMKNMNVSLNFNPNIGFGIQATNDICGKTRMTFAHGYFVQEDAPANTQIEQRGVIGGLWGPASLVNAGCSKHANARFVSGNADSFIVSKLPGKAIKKGAEILINYRVKDVHICAFEGCNITVTGTR